jgi:hypothetical protein
MFAGVLTLFTTACATAFAAGNAIDGDLSTEWGSRDGRIAYKSDWTSATGPAGNDRVQGRRADLGGPVAGVS